jgi:hypothetical protein
MKINFFAAIVQGTGSALSSDASNSTAALPPHSAVSLRLTVPRSLYDAASLRLAEDLNKARPNGQAQPDRTVLRQGRNCDY